MIGDASGKEGQFSDSDKKTAENFGIDYMDVDDFVNTKPVSGFKVSDSASGDEKKRPFFDKVRSVFKK